MKNLEIKTEIDYHNLQDGMIVVVKFHDNIAKYGESEQFISMMKNVDKKIKLVNKNIDVLFVDEKTDITSLPEKELNEMGWFKHENICACEDCKLTNSKEENYFNPAGLEDYDKCTQCGDTWRSRIEDIRDERMCGNRHYWHTCTKHNKRVEGRKPHAGELTWVSPDECSCIKGAEKK